MSFIVDNWVLLVCGLVVLIIASVAVRKFIALSSEEQLKKVREWLLIAVVEAEKELGGGTGKLKLRFVYDLFILRFTWMSRFISFDTFSRLVDEALLEMRELLSTNWSVQKLVSQEGDKND